jgi:hypothetical protein
MLVPTQPCFQQPNHTPWVTPSVQSRRYVRYTLLASMFPFGYIPRDTQSTTKGMPNALWREPAWIIILFKTSKCRKKYDCCDAAPRHCTTHIIGTDVAHSISMHICYIWNALVRSLLSCSHAPMQMVVKKSLISHVLVLIFYASFCFAQRKHRAVKSAKYHNRVITALQTNGKVQCRIQPVTYALCIFQTQQAT